MKISIRKPCLEPWRLVLVECIYVCNVVSDEKQILIVDFIFEDPESANRFSKQGDWSSSRNVRILLSIFVQPTESFCSIAKTSFAIQMQFNQFFGISRFQSNFKPWTARLMSSFTNHQVLRNTSLLQMNYFGANCLLYLSIRKMSVFILLMSHAMLPFPRIAKGNQLFCWLEGKVIE